MGGVFKSKTTRTDEEEAFLGTVATSFFFLNSGELEIKEKDTKYARELWPLSNSELET